MNIDITERKRAEEALRVSEERYELAVRGAGVGIWDWDIRTGKLYFSPRWKMLFGYDENDIGDSIEDWASLLHPDERDWILKFQDDFLAGTSPTVTVEYRLRHKDGSYRWIVAHALVVRDEQGKACRLVGSHGDITDRKRAEEELRQSRDELRAIYDGMRDGLLMADIETQHFVRVNASICRMLGYSEEELLSLSVRDIHPEADLPFVVEQFRALAEGNRSVSEEIPVLRKDGTVFYAVVSMSRVTYSDRRCCRRILFEMSRNAGRPTIAATKPRRTSNHLRAGGGWHHYCGRREGNPVRANSAFCRMVGYSDEEVYYVSPERLHPIEMLPAVLGHLETVKKGSVARIDDLPFLRKRRQPRLCGCRLQSDSLQRTALLDQFLPRRYRTQAGPRGFGAGAAVALENAPGQRPRTADHLLRDSRRAGPVSCRCGDAVSGS